MRSSACSLGCGRGFPAGYVRGSQIGPGRRLRRRKGLQRRRCL